MPNQRRTLLPTRQACYKCNMRRWMRDRGKRRKQQPDKPGQENPAPLQPKFPDSTPDEGYGEQPEFVVQPLEPGNQSESDAFEPAVQVGGGEEPPQQQVRRDLHRGFKGVRYGLVPRF